MASPYLEKPRYTLSQEKPERPAPATRAPEPDLSDDEIARTAALKQRHQELLPEFNEFVLELYKLGFIPGWRAVVSVERLTEDDSNPNCTG